MQQGWVWWCGGAQQESVTLLSVLSLLPYLALSSDSGRTKVSALQASDARFINASVEFDLATLKPTYRLLWGQGGLSNALAVAEGLGFDPLVVQRAREITTHGQVCDVHLLFCFLLFFMFAHSALDCHIVAVPSLLLVSALRKGLNCQEGLLPNARPTPLLSILLPNTFYCTPIAVSLGNSKLVSCCCVMMANCHAR